MNYMSMFRVCWIMCVLTYNMVPVSTISDPVLKLQAAGVTQMHCAMILRVNQRNVAEKVIVH